jgi:hypothetical protein
LRLTKNELKIFRKKHKQFLNGNYNFYQIDFKNVGGLVMPIILEFTFEDGTTEVQRIPVEIWRRNSEAVSKVFHFNKTVANITLDPYYETADVDLTNNNWPKKEQPSAYKFIQIGSSAGYSTCTVKFERNLQTKNQGKINFYPGSFYL